MPEILKVGDYIDLITAEDYTFKAPYTKNLTVTKENGKPYVRPEVCFSYGLIDLGVVIALPEGYEAILCPRSSTFRKFGLIQTNSIGIIDNTYCGPDDIWRMPVIATRNAIIPKGTPIAQFRIQLSQKATFWQKLKHLFSNKITLNKITQVTHQNRGGFGTGSDQYRTTKTTTVSLV